MLLFWRIQNLFKRNVVLLYKEGKNVKRRKIRTN